MSRTILRLLRSTEEHDELVQLSMIELVLGIDWFKGQCSLDSWISVVTAHVVFKHLRARRRDRLVFSALGEDGAPAYAVPGPSSGSLAVSRELLRRLSTPPQSVDDSKAEVFVLHDVHGYELKEVAEILGLTVANAQSRLVRGRKQLHELHSRRPRAEVRSRRIRRRPMNEPDYARRAAQLLAQAPVPEAAPVAAGERSTLAAMEQALRASPPSARALPKLGEVGRAGGRARGGARCRVRSAQVVVERRSARRGFGRLGRHVHRSGPRARAPRRRGGAPAVEQGGDSVAGHRRARVLDRHARRASARAPSPRSMRSARSSTCTSRAAGSSRRSRRSRPEPPSSSPPAMPGSR